MNIFEAIEKNGRAVLPSRLQFVYKNKDNEFCWYLYIDKGMKVSDEELMRNDWLPYVPCETVKHKEVFNEVIIYFTPNSDIKLLVSSDDIMRISKLPRQNIKMTLEWDE